MCMEDVRLGRESGSAYTARTLDLLQPAVILAPNPNRVGVILMTGTPSPIYCYPTGRPAGAEGIEVINTKPPIVMRIEEWGQIVTQGWTALDVSGGSILSVIEVFLERR